jgi:type IV pilus assembly protein PilC
MAEFLVKLADERGHVLEQVERGGSEKEIRDRFSHQGYLVYSIKGRSALSIRRLFGGRAQRIKSDQFIIFNQQFVTLIKAGLPILMSLNLLSRRQKDPYFKGLLEDVEERVRSGQLLSDAFAKQEGISKIYTTTVLAGERSGNLEEVLDRYISFQKVTALFRKKLMASLWYPALLFIALSVMLTFLMTFVVPKFAELYSSMNTELPAITVFMLSIGTSIRNYYYIILTVVILLAVGLLIWVRSENGARTLDSLRFKIPKFGGIWMKYQISMFSRTLSTLLAGGLPLVPSLETASNSINSRKIAATVEGAAQRVREGQSLSHSLEESKFFPDLAVEMIEVGESTGALPAMLNSVAEFYEDDVQQALGAMLTLVEPIILIFMGLTVATVLISLYLPVFSLGDKIH